MVIKLVVCAFEGVITDGKITKTRDGFPVNSFHFRDMNGIKGIQKYGINVGCISTMKDESIGKICDDMGFNMYFIGGPDKKYIVERWITQLGIDWSNVAYIGSDIDDLECMEYAKVCMTPSDCPISSITDTSTYDCNQRSGEGALRFFIDAIIEDYC